MRFWASVLPCRSPLPHWGQVFGSAFFDAGKLSLDLWLLGSISVSSTLVFDIGVYLVVVGLILTVLNELGDPEREEQ